MAEAMGFRAEQHDRRPPSRDPTASQAQRNVVVELRRGSEPGRPTLASCPRCRAQPRPVKKHCYVSYGFCWQADPGSVSSRILKEFPA